MSVWFQIFLGSAILIICTLIHMATMIVLARKLRAAQRVKQEISVQRTFIVASIVVFVMLASHTLHVYVWAISLWLLGALPGHEQPIYFTLVTYTTVGYGDTTLSPAFRVFGAMASVNGILAFGLTTAFLVGLIPRLFRALDD